MRAQRCVHRRPLRLHVHYLMRPILVPMARIERATSPLPRECSATELHGPCESENALPTETGGAGEGNRTLVVSLEGFCSTIELHPPVSALALTDARRLPMSQNWWRGKDSNLRRLSQQIYSLPPLTAREPLRTKPGIICKFLVAVKQLTDIPRLGAAHRQSTTCYPRCAFHGRRSLVRCV